MEDWEEWEMDSDVVVVAPLSGAVRFDVAPHIHEIEVLTSSPMLKYGVSPEMRTQSTIRRYWRPRERGSWEIRQNFLVRCHATPRRGMFVPDPWILPDGGGH